MASAKWHQKRTLVDLYIAREREAWYFKALAIITACLILLGFLTFAQAFAPTAPTSSTLTIVSAVFLALGYSLSVALWFICRSWLFQLDLIFLPCLIACILGTLNAGIVVGVNAVSWTAISIAAVALGAASSLIYAVLAYLVGYKIQRVRGSDRSTLSKRESSEALRGPPSEDELQRQNLLQLLGKKGEDRSPQQTYRIGIPDSSVAIRSPPPLTGAPQNLGISGTLANARGLSSEYTRYDNGALSPDLQRPLISPGVSPQRAALDAAREKARIAQARMTRSEPVNPPSPRGEDDTLPYPPIIVNTRHPYGDDISEIPLSERHPLERQEYERRGHIAGRSSKDKAFDQMYDAPGVYRSDEDFGGHDYDIEAEQDHEPDHDSPGFEIVEGENIHIDLSKDYVRQQAPRSPSHHQTSHSTLGRTSTPPDRMEYPRSRGSN